MPRATSISVELTAEVHARDAKDVEKLRQSLQLLEFMIKSQPGSGSAKLDFHEDHGTIRLALAISEADWKKAMEARRAAPVQKPAAGGSMVFTLPGKHR